MQHRSSCLPLGLLVVLVLALAGCSGSTSPSTPNFVQAGWPVLIEELDGDTCLPLDPQDVQERTVLSSVGGISSGTVEQPDNVVAQDQTIGIRLINDGFLELQIINFRERVDRGIPITDIQVFSDDQPPQNGGVEPFVRYSYYETPEDLMLGTVSAFRSSDSLLNCPQTWLTVNEITFDNFFVDFEMYAKKDPDRIVRIRSLTPDGAIGTTEAIYDLDPRQAFDPRAVIEVPTPLPPSSGGVCQATFIAGGSVDPNGNILVWGLDLNGNSIPNEGPPTIEPGPDLFAFDEANPANNTVMWPVPVTPTIDDRIPARVFVRDEEDRIHFSRTVVLDCQ